MSGKNLKQKINALVNKDYSQHGVNKHRIEIIMGILMLVSILLISHGSFLIEVNKKINSKENYVVVIDAGHGGFDPGKVAVNKALEKDINLSIALKLKVFLESQNITVIMTRTEDVGLYSSTDRNKKVTDMKERCRIINDNNAVIAVSIHQNSFSSGGVHGAQTFYYSKSDKGKALAEIVQQNIKRNLDNNNNRVAKANNNYYLLIHADCPIIIAECGFLSNWEEATLLSDDYYQEKMAWAIHLGIMEYIHKYVSI